MKRLVSFALFFMLVFTMCQPVFAAETEFAGGSGTKEAPYLIATAAHLNNVRNHLDKHFRQIADLDLSGYKSGTGWAPIGTSTTPFTGDY
jgi:hypothetical protein